MNNKTLGRDGRRAAYRGSFFLAAIILAGIGLSVLVNETSNAVRRMAHPLVQVTVPTLRGLADFESALLRYQLALNKYFAYSVDRDRFMVIERAARDEMDGRINYLLNSEMSDVEKQKIAHSYQAILALSPRLDSVLTTRPVNWEEARRILQELNTSTIEIRSELDEMQDRVTQSVNHAGDQVVKDVDQASWVVHSFIGATLLISLFLIYQFWSRAQSEQRLAFQAWHDPLTQLPNRRAFEKHVQDLGEQPYTVALGVIDRFERVTAGLGHRFADELIRELMARIATIVAQSGNQLFRLDGAGFVVVCLAPSDTEAAYTTIEELQMKVNEPFELGQREVRVSLSIGVAEYPAHGDGPIELLKNADAALQAARQRGGSGLMTYSSDLNFQAHEKLELEAALSHALERKELELYYQPQMSLTDKSLVGFEALVRWRRNGQLVSPADFIPVAEASGLIVPIGDWILEEACRQAKIWNDASDKKIVVAVNISPRQFRHPKFFMKTRNTLEQSGVDPSCIELEITEGIVLEGKDSIPLLRYLRQLGVALAVDDFGTGYSSLAYLKNLPINKLKIDQSFVRHLETDLNDAAIVKAVITLGHNLGVTVIAEGVETLEQRALLAGWACDEIQGYGYGKPMPCEQASSFITAAIAT